MKTYKEFINEDTQIINKGKQGDCYKNVEDYLLYNDLPDAIVVHGEVTSQGKTWKHAWIVNGDDAIDPTTGIITSKEKYYDKLKPVEDSRYDQFDAIKMRMKTKFYGPWSKEEEQKILGK